MIIMQQLWAVAIRDGHCITIPVRAAGVGYKYLLRTCAVTHMPTIANLLEVWKMMKEMIGLVKNISLAILISYSQTMGMFARI
jgi:hypothetical protein